MDSILSAEDFFAMDDHEQWSGGSRVAVRTDIRSRVGNFDALKVRMVMKIERCTAGRAKRIIAERQQALRKKESEEI